MLVCGVGEQEYENVEQLQYIILKHILFYVTSATMPDIVLQDIMNRMTILKDTYFFQQSNDRPNVHISVHKLKYPQNSSHDLMFLIPEGCLLMNLPPKFLIFLNSIPKSIEAAKYLQSLLPPELQYLIKWFNSDMSPNFCHDELAAMKDRKRAGLCCIDSFGMVSNILV